MEPSLQTFTQEMLRDCYEMTTGKVMIPQDVYETALLGVAEAFQPTIHAIQKELRYRSETLWKEAGEKGFLHTYRCTEGHLNSVFSKSVYETYHCEHGRYSDDEDECGRECKFIGAYCGPSFSSKDFNRWCQEDGIYSAIYKAEETLYKEKSRLSGLAWDHYSKRQPNSTKYPDAGQLKPNVMLITEELWNDIKGHQSGGFSMGYDLVTKEDAVLKAALDQAALDQVKPS
jgi:hypothetical protein